ncbi:MAG: tetratricopeptide repeat protein [Thermomicrobiales bacterium]
MAEVQQQQELRGVLQAAQAALEEGRPQEAIAACRHVLQHYPDSITALRLLGEACLEAGRSEEAGRAFDKALSLDPHNVLARVGLGVIAEDRGEDERAIAQFRLAWEVEPTLPQLRGELVRLYRKRYGAGGRLRLTRVALANLHKRNDELLRAISQFRQLYNEDPNRLEVTLSLAEALWRHDEDEEAAALCRAVLAERPRTARALLMLASIQGDNGGAVQGVDELLATARGFDPDLTLTGELIGLRPSETLLAFAGDVPTVPAFDPANAPLGGTDELLSQGVGTGALPVTRWEDIASGLTAETSGIASATNMGVVKVPTGASTPASDDVDELFAAIDRELAIANEHGTGALGDELPFELPPIQAEDPTDTSVTDEWDGPVEDSMMPTPDEPSAVERLTANWDNIDNELEAARPRDEAPIGMTGMLSALGDLEEDLVPFDVDRASEEEEETISFDPSKFSLPPLDDEDDDDAALGIDTAPLADEIAPFSLAEAGVRPKATSQTFADIVSKQAPLHTAASSEAPDAEPGAVHAAASIFETRELSSLPEDRLLELTGGTPDTDALLEHPDSVPGTSPILPLAEDEEPADALITAPQPLAAAPVAEAPAEAATTGSSTAELDKLLSTNAPRPVAPPPTDSYPVDSTRPLLGDETLQLGVAAAPTEEDHLVSKAPAAPPAEDDEVGMDKLFNRLRHRKQERIQTGDLLVNRRLQSSGQPGTDTGEIAGPLPKPKKRDRRLGGAAKPAASPVTPQETAVLDGGVTGETAALEPLSTVDLEEAPTGDTADFLAAIGGEALPASEAGLLPTTDEPVAEGSVDDSWLTSLVAAGTDTSEWAANELDDKVLPAAVNGAAHTYETEASDEPSFAELLSSTTPPVAAEATDTVTDWGMGAGLDDMPEQPAPPTASRAATGAGEDLPHWGEEALDEVVAQPTPPVARRGTGPVPRNGHHEAPAREPRESVVMRVRTTNGTGPVVMQTPRTVAPPRPILRQTAQLASLNAMVEAEPDNHFARLTLAVAYVSARLPDQALGEYRRLIKDAEDLIPEVVERLKEMIADGEAPPRAHRVLGDAYMKLGQFDLAMAEFQRALLTRPRVAK